MKNSIRRKHMTMIAGILTGFIVLNILLTYLLMIPFSVKLSLIQLDGVAKGLSGYYAENEQGFTERLEHIEEDMNTRVTVVDAGGHIFFTTSERLIGKESLREGSPSYKILRDNIEKLDVGKAASFSRIADDDLHKQIQVYIARKIGYDRYAIFSRSYRSLENSMRIAVIFEIFAGMILLLIGLLAAKRFSDAFVKPIIQITEVAEHISNLEFDKKADETEEDELGILAASINRMSDHLQVNVEQLREDIENRKKLVRNLSHEIRSPLTVIVGYADRMKKVIGKNPEKALDYCNIISDESSRVDLLVKEMLDFSKLEQDHTAPEKETFEAKKLFEEIRRQFYQEHMIPAGAEGKEEKPKIDYIEQYRDGDVIYADFYLLLRAVHNLLRNAVTYAGGAHCIIRVTGENRENDYQISVYNSGSHIPKEELQSIWEPFSKVDKVRSRSQKGYGLGLSIVKEIVQQHHGSCSVRNVDDGVLFTISVCRPADRQ
ncbi:MAG: HAMP domain-containing histidine kinase [Lachnospiraceae bacterium]|nr:HAMP domain-containing histidine kinase [Lachnospiraceae bacterium]